MDLSWLTTLSPSLQNIILGSAGSAIGGLATTLATQLLGATGYAIKKRFKAEPQQQALENALSAALVSALQEHHLDDESFQHCLEMFQRWIEQEKVAGELSQLIDPQPECALDMEVLQSAFEALGYDADWLDWEWTAFVTRFAQLFHKHAADDEILRECIHTQALLQLVQTLSSVESHTERTANASEKAVQLLQQLLEKNASRESLHATFAQVLQQGYLQQFRFLESVMAELRRKGYDPGFLDDGRVEIGQTSLQESSAFKPTLVSDLIEELSGLRQTIVGHSPSTEEVQQLEERYRTHIIRWFEHLSFQGMITSSISLPLEKIYVELRAVAEVPVEADAFSIDERRLLLGVDEDDPQGKQELLRQMDGVRRERWNRSLNERSSIIESLFAQKEPATVILGDPGSGKSTLLHFLALVFAKGSETIERLVSPEEAQKDRLPIFVPLAAYDDMLKKHPDLDLLEFLPRYYEQRRGIPGLRVVLRQALEAGRALVLLDGLDEVLDSSTRRLVSNRVKALIDQWQSKGVRFAITSRFVGYREAPLPGMFPHLSVMDFRQAEIETFVHQWAHVYEVFQARGEESPETIRLAQKLEADLLHDVRSNPNVQRLAANPLMLTMLALIRRQVGRLPQRRISLYERYIRTLIENWIEFRSCGERTQSLDALDVEELEDILIPLSLWLHCEKPSGTAARQEILTQLKRIYREKYELDPSTASKRSKRFLDEMRHLAGLIVERGYDAYGFLHLTFQEYFVGRALAQLEEGPRWEMIRPHRHNPRWQEPILLCAGWLGIREKRQPQVTQLVQQLLDCPDPTEPHLHRNLILALTIAGDDVGFSPKLWPLLKAQFIHCFPTDCDELAEKLTQLAAILVGNDSIVLTDWFVPEVLSDDDHTSSMRMRPFVAHVQNSQVEQFLFEQFTKGKEYVQKFAARALLPLLPQRPAWRDIYAKKMKSDVYFAAHIWGHKAFPPPSQDSYWHEVVMALVLEHIGKMDDWLKAGPMALLSKDVPFCEDVFLRLKDHENLAIRGDLISICRSLILSHDFFRSYVWAQLDSNDQKLVDYAIQILMTAPLELEEIFPQLPDLFSKHEASILKNLGYASEAFIGLPQVKPLLHKALSGRNFFPQEDFIRGTNAVLEEDSSFRREIFELVVDPNAHQNVFEIIQPFLGHDPIFREKILEWLNHDEFLLAVRVSVLKMASHFWEESQEIQHCFQQTLQHPARQIRQTAIEVLRETPIPSLPKMLAECLDDLRESERWKRYHVFCSRAQAKMALSETQKSEILAWLKDLLPGNSPQLSTLIQQVDAQTGAVPNIVCKLLAPLAVQDSQLMERIIQQMKLPEQIKRLELQGIKCGVELFHEGSPLNEALFHALEKISLGDRNFSNVIRAFKPLVATVPQVRERMERKLQSPHEWIKEAEMDALSPALQKDTELVQQFKGFLLDSDVLVRLATASAFIESCSFSDLIPSHWKELLDCLRFDDVVDLSYLYDSQHLFRKQILLADAMAKHLEQIPQLKTELLSWLEDARLSARQGALLVLDRWPGGAPVEIQDRMEQARQDQRDLRSFPARLAAAAYLINRDPHSQTSIQVCLQALSYGTETWEYMRTSREIRKQAVSILGSLEALHYEESVYQALLKVLQNDSARDVRNQAYRALVSLARLQD